MYQYNRKNKYLKTNFREWILDINNLEDKIKFRRWKIRRFNWT